MHWPSIPRSAALTSNKLLPSAIRCFSGASLCAKQLPPRPIIEETDIDESFLKGSGPGGQKINKTSSAVQLKHLPTGIVIKSQATRSRSQNRSIARKLLAEKLEYAEKGSESRIALKISVKAKKKANKRKKAKRKYGKPDSIQESDQEQEETESAESDCDNSGPNTGNTTKHCDSGEQEPAPR